MLFVFVFYYIPACIVKEIVLFRLLSVIEVGVKPTSFSCALSYIDNIKYILYKLYILVNLPVVTSLI